MKKVLFFIMALLTAATAWAETQTVSYIDADGTTQTCNDYTVLHTGDDISNLPGGWYVVSENAEFSSEMHFSRSASIILCDGKTLSPIPNPQIYL